MTRALLTLAAWLLSLRPLPAGQAGAMERFALDSIRAARAALNNSRLYQRRARLPAASTPAAPLCAVEV